MWFSWSMKTRFSSINGSAPPEPHVCTAFFCRTSAGSLISWTFPPVFPVSLWTVVAAWGLRCFYHVKMLPSCVPRLRLHCLFIFTWEVESSAVWCYCFCEWLKLAQKLPRLPSNSVIWTKALQMQFNQNNLHYFRLIRVFTAMNTFSRPSGTVFLFWWHQAQQQWKTACHLGRKHRGGRGVGSGVACSRAEGRGVTQIRKQDIWLQEPRHRRGRFHCSLLDHSTVQNQLKTPVRRHKRNREMSPVSPATKIRQFSL